MKLIQVKLTNFRGYDTETTVDLNSLTVLVGRNDAGKSSILDALDIYFNGTEIEREDCCVHTGANEVRISCVFDELPTSLVIDEQHATSLEAEHLLRQDGKLEIVKSYDCSGAKGKLLSAAARAYHPSAPGLDDLLTLKIEELKKKAERNGVDLSSVNIAAKAPIRAALWQAQADLALTEREISLKKEAAKDALDQLQKQMPLFALFRSDRESTDQDDEAQDPLKAAVREAIRRRESELGSVIADIKAEVAAVAALTVAKIREMSPDLANELHPQVKNKNWDSLFGVTLTGENDIPINKRGSGTRRLILLNFFRAKADGSAQASGNGVIYAIEEPETSQHPNHQLMLLDAFEQMIERGNCQILLTTHTPTLARRVSTSSLRLISRTGKLQTVENGIGEPTIEKIVRTLGVLPDHDVKVFFGVEGKNDINFLKEISSILSATESDIPDLKVAERSGTLVFVPLGGSSLELWITRLQKLNRAEFYLTDRDNPPHETARYQSQVDGWNARTGCKAWVTGKKELENYIHPSLLLKHVPSYDGTGSDFEDVPLLLAQATHQQNPAANAWAELADKKIKEKTSGAKKIINFDLVCSMTPELLQSSDQAGEVRGWLREIGIALRS